jgi:hypothetical protein
MNCAKVRKINFLLEINTGSGPPAPPPPETILSTSHPHNLFPKMGGYLPSPWSSKWLFFKKVSSQKVCTIPSLLILSTCPGHRSLLDFIIIIILRWHQHYII